ncbi:MAG: hypothetical protein Solumvirus2_69 [Solumvirus sp.]|uniref:MORN repeat-containing protein n=1 Tax=Solumvirus sp. TaxID=2487773 RepID=A0A3G5AGF7_9VIRU|nr:MAG: hypothetical protein Solumvirus2_69 [Solumvirus sp.]
MGCVSPQPIKIKTEYYKDGKIREECEYSGIHRHGECLIYYNNGVLSNKIIYDMGQRVGLSEKYDENGKLSEAIEYKANCRHGLYKLWFPGTSIIKMIGFYHYDAKHGPWEEYSQKGDKTVSNYHRGHLVTGPAIPDKDNNLGETLLISH